MFAKLFSGSKSICRVCHAWPSRVVCEDCISRFAQPQSRCHTCAMPMPDGCTQCGACLKEAPALDQCLAAVPYAFPWSDLVADFKFHAQPGLAHMLAQLLMATPWVEDTLANADLLLPMPLSDQRLKERGYNQALLLARALDSQKTRHSLLLRLHDTPAQHTLPRAQRLVALQGVLATEPLLQHQLQGQRVLLVDDVMTTGASLNTAARCVRHAGASHVSALVFARTH